MTKTQTTKLVPPEDDDTISITELLAELDGRLSYRMIDYWIRNGAIILEQPGHGSGSRRRITPVERKAIFALVEAYERNMAEMTRLRTGELFLELLGWNDITLEDAS